VLAAEATGSAGLGLGAFERLDADIGVKDLSIHKRFCRSPEKQRCGQRSGECFTEGERKNWWL